MSWLVVRSAETGVGPERGIAFMPPPERFEREDARRVTVIPRDAKAPGTVELGVLDAKRRRAARAGPDLLSLVTKATAEGARARSTEGRQVESGHMPVEERDRDALFPGDVDRGRLVPLVHPHSLLQADTAPRSELLTTLEVRRSLFPEGGDGLFVVLTLEGEHSGAVDSGAGRRQPWPFWRQPLRPAG
jgi:hypothetical protein